MNSSFSQAIPGLQVAWDSTSMGQLKTCPRLYYYSIVLGYFPKGSSIHLEFGLRYHAALETYDHARAAGLDWRSGVRAALVRCLRDTWNYELNRPWSSDDPNKNRLTLVRSVIWYLDQFRDDPAETLILASGKPAVELSFRFPTEYMAPDGQPFMMCGHLDRVATLAGSPYIFDRKTTKFGLDDRFFAQFTPNNQMSTYAFAGKIIYSLPIQGIIIDGVQVLVGGSRFARAPISRTPGQLDEWYREWGHWVTLASEYAEANYWPMNDKACGNYGGCPFLSICSKDPAVRSKWLNNHALFVRRIWDPLQVRGDV